MIGHSDEHSLTTLLKWMSKIMARKYLDWLKCLVLIKDINLQLNDGKLTISITGDETNETQEKELYSQRETL